MIRAARPRDCARLSVLSDQLGYPASARQIRESLARIAKSKTAAVFVADSREGKTAGWIEVHQRPPLLADGGAEAEVMGLVVDQSIRRQGIGRKLIKAAEEWAKARGCVNLRVRTNTIRADAHAFYSGLGYSKLKTQTVFRKSLG